jgi:hypothetical protein
LAGTRFGVTAKLKSYKADDDAGLQYGPCNMCCDTLEAMLFESDKVMFEIYRETEYTGKYRVVYFTELQDHNKETEINHALAGEHFFDGFIKNFRKDEAKGIIDSLLERLNNGEAVGAAEVERALGDHMA